MSPENETSPCCGCNLRTIAYAVGILGSFLVVALLVSVMKKEAAPPPVNKARAEERAKALKEVRAAEAAALKEFAWRDQGKGFVKIPVENAKQIVLREWQNPAVARSNMNARVDALNVQPPPPKSDFE